MKVYSITLFSRINDDKATVLAQAVDVSQFGFFEKGTVKEFLLFGSRETISRTRKAYHYLPGQSQSVSYNQNNKENAALFFIHAAVDPLTSVGGVVITEKEYPQSCLGVVFQIDALRSSDLLNPYNLESKYCVCSDCLLNSYPARVAHALLRKAVEDLVKMHGTDVASKNSTADVYLNLPTLSEKLKMYQEPDKVDDLMKITRDLEETREILLTSIDKLLVKQGKLEELAAKSADLSFQSKAFAKASGDLNKCCVII